MSGYLYLPMWAGNQGRMLRVAEGNDEHLRQKNTSLNYCDTMMRNQCRNAGKAWLHETDSKVSSRRTYHGSHVREQHWTLWLSNHGT